MSTPEPESSGLPLRALAMVLLSAAIVFAGIGWLTLGSDDAGPAQPDAGPAGVVATERTPSAPDRSAAPTAPGEPDDAQADDADSGAASTGASIDMSAFSVRVYNNSTVDGLAARVADDLTADGWTVDQVANYDEGVIPTTTVYYGDAAGERAAAEELAARLGVRAEPRFEGIADAPPGLIVILTSDADGA